MIDLFQRLFRGARLIRKPDNGHCVYSGPYHTGRATYEYVETGQGRCYEGSFRYVERIVERVEAHGVLRITGRYAADKKCGTWRYERSGSGYRRKLVVNYKNGVPDGELCYTGKGNSYGFPSSKMDRSLTVIMREGCLAGHIRGLFGEDKLYGTFDEEGYPDGLWTLGANAGGSTKACYERWNHGVLVESYTVEMSTGVKEDSPERMRSVVKDMVFYEWLPMVDALRRDSAVWCGSIKCRH